jgi:hypothetical protein
MLMETGQDDGGDDAAFWGPSFRAITRVCRSASRGGRQPVRQGDWVSDIQIHSSLRISPNRSDGALNLHEPQDRTIIAASNNAFIIASARLSFMCAMCAQCQDQ